MVATNKKIVERMAEMINDHHIETGFAAEPMYMKNTSSTTKLPVHIRFMF